ncbi:hypothetical protein EWM62_13915 [Mucilaginibacter terrigena]|uniref:Uncharacterized protein n=1 Tax=Mucilaginibacter terrigena TaxID=2492395 RepID=A0A4Q5LJ64_9SPHI|nr:hypothetical protein [Mucilaginibacter terrigena]RYU89418.1 hypothetical protein EWM62_13915 [Mucilaginibacter terrigena]
MKEKGQTPAPDFSKNLEGDIQKYQAEGKTIEAFLKARYQITDLKDLDFDLKDKDESQFGFQKVRGSVNLMMGNIRTYKQSQDLIEEVLGYDLESLINYKP